MQKQCGKLQIIDEYHTSYLGFQYLLLFPYGKDGYISNVKHWDKGPDMQVEGNSQLIEIVNEDIPWEQATKRNRLTIREWLDFRTQSRPNEAQTRLRSRRIYPKKRLMDLQWWNHKGLNGSERINQNWKLESIIIWVNLTPMVKHNVQTREREMCFLHHMLSVVDIWINSTLTEWKYEVTLDSQIFSLLSHAILTDLKFNVFFVQCTWSSRHNM